MNNSATTRRIYVKALEYNGNDKGKAETVETNSLLGNTPQQQFYEMKIIASRNNNVQKWAFTGYISPPENLGKTLNNEELKEITKEALKRVGVTQHNQYRLDIHNSTKQKHIHFLVNRIDVNGKCTVESRNIGKRFGEAVRNICKERGIKTDVEIGIEKKKLMLEVLKKSIQKTDNFDSLQLEMSKKKFLLDISNNIKDGVSGLRITKHEDINFETEKIYKSGYKLSEITNKLKIVEIKQIFELNNKIKDAIMIANNWNEFKNYLYQEKILISKNSTTNTFIVRIIDENQKLKNSGVFYSKQDGYLLSDIDNNELIQKINALSIKESFYQHDENYVEKKTSTPNFENHLLTNSNNTQDDDLYNDQRKRRKYKHR